MDEIDSIGSTRLEGGSGGWYFCIYEVLLLSRQKFFSNRRTHCVVFSALALLLLHRNGCERFWKNCQLLQTDLEHTCSNGYMYRFVVRVIFHCLFPFSAVALLVGQQEGHLACNGCRFVDGDSLTEALHIL